MKHPDIATPAQVRLMLGRISLIYEVARLLSGEDPDP
jgi:hypothetical protein